MNWASLLVSTGASRSMTPPEYYDDIGSEQTEKNSLSTRASSDASGAGESSKSRATVAAHAARHGMRTRLNEDHWSQRRGAPEVCRGVAGLPKSSARRGPIRAFCHLRARRAKPKSRRRYESSPGKRKRRPG